MILKNEKSLSEVNGSVDTTLQSNFWKKLFAFIGPAYLISVGYMDPGNWATDIAGGSHFGYLLLWVLLLSNLIALLLQNLSARLGLVSGLDLAQASRQNYPPFINFFLWILAEIAIAACDLAEVIGMAIGLNLLFGLPMMIGVVITIFDTFILLMLQRYGMRKMEAIIIALILIIGIAFFIEMFFVHPDVKAILINFIPSALNKDSLYIAVGIIGATVMPHNLYLHSSLVQTRKINRSEKGIKAAIKFNIIDTSIALNLAFFVNAAILIMAAAAFYTKGLYNVTEIQDAYKLLTPLLGSKIAPLLFAIALIAAGQSSTLTGTLSGQIVMEGYLNLRIQPWLRRIITRSLAILPAFFTLWYFGDDKISALLILSQVVLSLQLGFAIVPLIHFVSDKKIMGKLVIKTYLKILAWICAIFILALNIQLVYETIIDWLSNNQF
ncbi:MAG TPA: Nramp family divalent metal transporter, partial [Bacteroidia bacterium]|nr:Nramp family divalent metal transporter [Bacteroidia bacterium]